MAQRRPTFWRRLRPRLAAGVALLAYAAAAFGLPLPEPGPRKDRSRPYPCMDHACGCLCAEDCWRHCCCFTPAERWAWAEAHGVQPPDYAERPDADAAPCHSCCDHDHAPPESPAPWAVTLSALRCRGLTTLWVAAGAVLPPPAPLAWAPPAPPAGGLPLAAARASRLPQPPPSPPPR